MRRASILHPSPSPKQPRAHPAAMAYVALDPPHSRAPSTFSWASDQLTPPPPYDLHDALSSAYSTDPRANIFCRSPDGATRAPGLPRRGQATNLSIPHLREALNSLESKMASLLSERELLELRLEQAVRLQAPIQRLPNELLASIFVIGVLETGEQDSLMLSTLMLVCRYWKEVAINTPILWSRIMAGTHHSLDRARLKLERSKAAPLEICVDFSPRLEHGTVTTESVVHTMDLLRPSIWRWRTFQLTVPNRPQAHAALMRCKEQAPMLEALSVQVIHSMQEEHHSTLPLALFASSTPRLRSCSFSSFNFGWDIGLVSGLRVLKLGGYWNGVSPSIDVILGILRACPQLEELALRHMSDVDPDPHALLDFDHSEQGDFTEKLVRVNDARMIQLPRLTKASFYYSGVLRTRMILSLLSFPALERIELCFMDNVAPVVEHLRRQSLTSLPLRHLRIESSFVNEMKLVRLLRRLPALTSLELVDIEDLSSNLIKTLSAPPPSQTWLCPKLTSLSLEGCTTLDWEAIRSFVESRLPAQSLAYPRQLITPPMTLPTSTTMLIHSTPVSTASATTATPTITSSASAFATQAHILARTPVRPTPNPTLMSLGLPQRLQSIDLTRCHQISKEMVQWLRMYVTEVKCETVKSVWGEATMA